ncbi:MAG TPA: acyltransferase [Oligoflexia bacterium]|nr:acyltransferase [Oligoflexia bacterium]HMP48492.1 acyltransferase [Oligoflexia bacterium]
MKFKQYFIDIFRPNPNRDTVIDAVRVLSVLSVLAFHVVTSILKIGEFEGQKHFVLNMPPILQPLWHGEKGVDAFFLISATVLGISLFSKLKSFDFSDALSFYKKRFWRIYPLFFVALVLYSAFNWSYHGKYFWSNLFLVNNLIEGQISIIPVGWSLLVEVQYYALLPLLFLVLKKIKYKFQIILTLIALSFMCCALRLMQYPELYMRPLTDLLLAEDRSVLLNKMGKVFYEANSTRFGAFAVGLLLAYIKVFEFHRIKFLFSRKINSVVFFTLAILCILAGSAMPVYHPDSFWYSNFNTVLHFCYLMSVRQIFAFGLMLLILGSWCSNWCVFRFLKSVSKSRIWLPISCLSYPMYLFHFPFLNVAISAVCRNVDSKQISSISFQQGFGIFCLATLLTFIFSIPCHVFVERPLIEYGKRSDNDLI